jgi:hypothetical protein
MASVPFEPPSFDVRAFAGSAQGSLRSDIDEAAFAASPLTDEVLRLLAVLARLEGATMSHLRNVLVTPTHKDARVTAFLVTWAFERFWVADALRAVVDAGGGSPRSSEGRRMPRAAVSRRGPVRRALAGFAQGWPIVGAHLTLGLVDDWILAAAYERADEFARHEALSALIARIVAVKARHTAFFEEESRRRLACSARAGRLARRELRHSVLPIGADSVEPDDLALFRQSVFGGIRGAGLAVQLERRIAGLPHLDHETAARVRRVLAT